MLDRAKCEGFITCWITSEQANFVSSSSLAIYNLFWNSWLERGYSFGEGKLVLPHCSLMHFSCHFRELFWILLEVCSRQCWFSSCRGLLLVPMVRQICTSYIKFVFRRFEKVQLSFPLFRSNLRAQGDGCFHSVAQFNQMLAGYMSTSVQTCHNPWAPCAWL